MIVTRPYRPEFELTDAERERVLFEIYGRLGRLVPDALLPVRATAAGGLMNVEQHVPEIVDVVRRSSAERIEPYLAQFLDDVCPRCPNQEPSVHCPLRHTGSCVLFHYPETIVAAVRNALREIEARRKLS